MRHCFLPVLLPVSLFFAIPDSFASEQTTQTKATMAWPKEKAWEWYKERGWTVGFNFLPSNAVNSTEMWAADTFDPETIDRELRWASDLGFNSCRVYLQYLLWEQDAQGYKERIGKFLDIAASHGMTVMPVLFDDVAFSGKEPYLGKQDDPVPGVHNSGWTPSPGLKRVDDKKTWPKLRAYVQDIILHFGQDERILLWDLYNEPGNSNLGNKSLPLLKATFQWAREVKPAQPLSSGIWNNDLQDINETLAELSDVITFHAYEDFEAAKSKIKQMTGYGRPVICTEWLRRGVGNTFQNLLPIFKKENIGCYNWGLVAGKTQTYYPWGSKAGDPEPKQWQHDLLRQDGKPFDPEEADFIRSQLWRPLFNGKDLENWEISGKARWAVEDGILVGRQGPNREHGDLLTVEDFDDFLVTLTYRIHWPANSGLWFRYQSADQAFQADILEYKDPVAWSGSLYCTGKMFIGINEDPSIVDREGWNTMTVLANGEHLVVHLNGHKTVDVRDDTSFTGKIGFQIHAGDQFETMFIEVREIRIRPLN